MATSKLTPPPSQPPPPPTHHYYSPIPTHDSQNYFVLPYFQPPPAAPRRGRCRIICTVMIIVIAALVYIFWPSDPQLKITRLHLNRIHVHTLPVISIDVSMCVTIKVHNVDVYSMDYRGLDVAVGYRGKKLGHVKSHRGHVRALGSSYVDAELEFNGVQVLSDVVMFLEDLARGAVPFDTVTAITGRLGLFFLHFPLETKVSCGILINTVNQSILRQNCYPDTVMNWTETNSMHCSNWHQS